MAEWLGRALQKLLQRFESARCLNAPLFRWGFLLFVVFYIFTAMDTEISDLLLKYTLFPIFGWGFLWLMDQLEHLFIDTYFKWTLRVERPKRPLMDSAKDFFGSVFVFDLKKAQTHLIDISKSGFLKFVVAYFLGVCLVELGEYSWLQIGRNYS